jgi:hypothetical protein
MLAAEACGKHMKSNVNRQKIHFTPTVTGFSLSRPWLVLVRLRLLFTQVVAAATTFAPERRPDAPVQRQDP